MKNKFPMSVRIVEGDYSQTLMRVVSFEITNTTITTVHDNGNKNTAEFSTPASIFVMINKVTIDHIKR